MVCNEDNAWSCFLFNRERMILGRFYQGPTQLHINVCENPSEEKLDCVASSKLHGFALSESVTAVWSGACLEIVPQLTALVEHSVFLVSDEQLPNVH